MLLLALLLFVLSVILVFVWRVFDLMDELSGRKAKRQIQRLHELNVGTGTFDKLSTNEIYSGLSSGSLANGELLGLAVGEESLAESVESDAEINVSLSVDADAPTSFMQEGALEECYEEDMTGILDSSKPVIIEEQGSIL